MAPALALVSACSGSTQSQTGASAQQIQGGQLETGYPAVGLVQLAGGGFCNGTLIAPSVVLTARHCQNPTGFNTGTSGADFVSHPVDKNIPYPQPSNEGIFQNDAQIVHLSSPIIDILPMHINTGGSPSVGTTCTAVGFGQHTEGGTTTAGTKRSASVVIDQFGRGLDAEDGIAMKCPNGSCTPFVGTGVPDHGDSGGPLLCDGRIVGTFSGWVNNDARPWYLDMYSFAVWDTNVAAEYSTEPLSSVLYSGSGNLDMFVRGIDGHAYHKGQNPNGDTFPSGLNWESLGGDVVGTPEAVSWGPNRLDVFVRGTDLGLYHKAWDGSSWQPSQTDWEGLGGSLVAHPAAVSWAANRLDIFAVGSDGQMVHKAWDGSSWQPSQTDWEGLGGGFLGPVKAVSWAANRLDIFGVGTDNVLYHKAWDGSSWQPSQTDWDNMGGFVVANPSVVSWGPNRLDLFAKSSDNAIYHKAWDGSSWQPSQTGWESLGGFVLGSPSAGSYQAGQLHIAGRSTDGVYVKRWDGSQWIDWSRLPDGLATGSPVLAPYPGTGVGVFAGGPETFDPNSLPTTAFAEDTTFWRADGQSDPDGVRAGWSQTGTYGGIMSW
jgi:hypothetical protein